MPPDIVSLSSQLLRDPVNINVTPSSSSVVKIDQQVLFFDAAKEKLKVMQQILSDRDVSRALVFTRTKRGADRLTKILAQGGLKSTAIHGNKSQNARQRALTAFRQRKINILIATDVAARGIDIDRITHVINFDIPVDPESYVHRIGRTGRAGARGIALSFCAASERNELRAIEKFIGKKIPVDKARSTCEPIPVADRPNRRPNRKVRRRSTESANATPGSRSGARRSRPGKGIAAGPSSYSPRSKRRRPDGRQGRKKTGAASRSR